MLGACAASGARAEPRFRDSTWVAPAMVADSVTADSGPRVALPDRPRAWETALRAPFRVAFSPLRLVVLGVGKVGDLVMPPEGEPMPVKLPRTGPRFGPQFRVGGVSDIGAGPAMTWPGFPRAGARLDVSGTLSTKDRRTFDLRETIGAGRPVGFRLRGAYDYHPNRNFYGIGNDAPRADSSVYLLAATTVDGTLLLGRAPRRQLRLRGGYSSLSPRRGYFGSPLLEDVFTPSQVPFEHRTTQEVLYGAGGDWAALDEVRNPSAGVHARADLERDVGVRASDPDFDRWRLEGRAYLPVFAPRRVLAFRGVYEGIDPRGSTTSLPFDRLPNNEEEAPFAGYTNHRFTDRQLVLARLEYRWIILYKVSAIALYERTEVAPQASAFTYRAAHPTWGGGLRYPLTDLTTVRLELGKSRDGLHAAVRMGSDW